jgi:hypothetical protein
MDMVKFCSHGSEYEMVGSGPTSSAEVYKHSPTTHNTTVFLDTVHCLNLITNDELETHVTVLK